MVDFDIANRPFATHPMTGLMMPDGIFDTALGVQELHAQLRNTTAGAFAGTKVYMESVSDPNIITFPDTHDLSGLASNAIRTLSWRVDMTNAEPGEHYVSFVSTGPTGITRVIKKIFVTQTTFDPSTGTFNVDVPQGRLNVEFVSLFAPAEPCSSVRLPLDRPRAQRVARSLRDDRVSFLDLARELYSEHRADFVFCPPGYLPKRVRLTLTPTPAYAGQYGTLPFEDPFWKALLCILGVVLLAATAIVEAVWGTGSVTATTGSANDRNCCNTQAEGGGTNEVAAILAGGAAAAFTAAGLSDARDPMRRGQDHTPPASGEITVGETLNFELIPRDPVALGRPFQVDTRWDYQRITNSTTRSHNVSETQTNIHVLSRYEISAPDTIHNDAGDVFQVMAQFFDAENKLLRGDQLFVQCFLIDPHGRSYRLPLHDDGLAPDTAPNDGTYSGSYDFLQQEMEPGLWTYFVIAQDVNNARPDMEADEAAQIIGGMVVTHQLTIGFSGGTCPLTPDGQVTVV